MGHRRGGSVTVGELLACLAQSWSEMSLAITSLFSPLHNLSSAIGTRESPLNRGRFVARSWQVEAPKDTPTDSPHSRGHDRHHPSPIGQALSESHRFEANSHSKTLGKPRISKTENAFKVLNSKLPSSKFYSKTARERFLHSKQKQTHVNSEVCLKFT